MTIGQSKDWEESEEQVKLPTYKPFHLPTILATRDRLVRSIEDNELRDRELTPDQFHIFCGLILEGLPSKCYAPAVEDSIRYLAGEFLTKAKLQTVCHRLAGNIERLACRRAVPPWSVQRFQEWVPLQIVGYRPARGKRDRLGALLSLKIMAGTPCPIVIQDWWSPDMCRFMAYRNFGFSRPRGDRDLKYPYTNPLQFTSLRFLGLVQPDKSTKEPSYTNPTFPNHLVEWNKETLRRRFRVDPGYKCPKGHPQHFPCHTCPIGYLKCPAGTHRRNWQKGTCTVCEKADVWIDVDLAKTMCVNCYFTDAKKRTK